MSRPRLRAWQTEALERWIAAGHRGIISVVTGGGKTVFALSCIQALAAETTLIVVPTVALLDQWWEEVSNYFGLHLDEVNVLTGRGRLRRGTINLGVLNTSSRYDWSMDFRRDGPLFLIVDECHKAASEKFRAVLSIPRTASLGLSATPERPYDTWLPDILVPALGTIIYEYSYRDALRDGVIVPFLLRNIVFDLEPERQADYDKLTKAIARAASHYGIDAEETISLMLRRTRVVNLSLNRIRLAVRLIASHSGKRTLVFHEDIQACDLLFRALTSNSVHAGIYHSKMTLRERVAMLASFRSGNVSVLVTCRALDEGFNLPETEVGIVAASTATRRQRIQRLGRVLRPSAGKEAAVVYTLVATTGEIGRLQQEEESLDGVAEVQWSRA